MAKAKILLVEDDDSIRNLYSTKLTKEGYAVDMAENGAVGLKKAQETIPDIILLDVMMPIMNGFEVLKKLREDKKTEEIPVIILSNYGEVDQMTEGFISGATDYLIKAEHTPADVVDIVESTLSTGKNIVAPAFDD